MRCEYYERLMNRLLDEGLSEADEAELKEHMRSCPDCTRQFALLSRMTVVLREDLAEPPASLAQGVMARIAAGAGTEAVTEEAPAEERPVRRRPAKKATVSLRPWTRWAVAACLVLVIAGGGIAALRGMKMGSSYSAADTAEAPRSADMAAPQAAAGAYNGAAAETAIEEESAEEKDGITFEEAAEGAVDDAMDEAVAFSAAEDSAELPEGALPIYDVAGNTVGTVPEENLEAFAALLTDAGWGKAGPPAADWDYLFKVNYQSTTYAFGVSGDILVWWDVSGQKVARSPGTPDDLRELIDVVAPIWPE